MSLSIEGTRRYMLATEAPLLRGVEGLPQTLTQMDAAERIKLDEEQQGRDAQITQLTEQTKPAKRFWGNTAFTAVGAGCLSLSSMVIFRKSEKTGFFLLAATVICGQVVNYAAQNCVDQDRKVTELSLKISDEVLDARIDRLKSKIRFLDERLQTELQGPEKEQINRGKDYLSLGLAKIMSERLNRISVEVEHVRNF